MTEEMMITAFSGTLYTADAYQKSCGFCTKGCPVYFYTTREIDGLYAALELRELPYHSPIRRLSWSPQRPQGFTPSNFACPMGDANEFIFTSNSFTQRRNFV